MQSTMSLLGMYNYDNSILDLLALPEELDSNVVKDNLLMETAELELLYTNFGFMRQAIGSWSAKQLPIWNELYATTQYEYNPIWNKDGTIEETIERDITMTNDLTDEQTRNLSITNDSTNTGYVYGFNSSTEAPADKAILDHDSTDTGTITDTHTGTRRDAGSVTTKRTEQGNIGLTSTQELIRQQRDTVTFNIIDVIIKDFIDRFCLRIY